MVTTNTGHYYNIKGPKEDNTRSRQTIDLKSIYNFLGLTGSYSDLNDVKIHGELYRDFFDRIETATSVTMNLFDEEINSPNLASFELKTTYPGLLTGTGYMHPCPAENDFQMGFFFDWTTGAPIIAGSTVKGVLREPFPLRNKDEEIKD